MEVATIAEPPSWTRHFMVPGLELLEEKREYILSEIRKLEESLSSVDGEVTRRRSTCDCLLSGVGDALVDAVAETMTAFGAGVTPMDGQHDQFLLLRTGGRDARPVAVLYVLGAAQAIQRRDVRTLADTVNDLWDQLGDPRPKGILVANTYHELDPRERHQEAFPEELHSFCHQNEFCLLTTGQLFNAYYALSTGDLKDGMAFVQSLLKTSLEYPKFRNFGVAVRS